MRTTARLRIASAAVLTAGVLCVASGAVAVTSVWYSSPGTHTVDGCEIDHTWIVKPNTTKAATAFESDYNCPGNIGVRVRYNDLGVHTGAWYTSTERATSAFYAGASTHQVSH